MYFAKRRMAGHFTHAPPPIVEHNSRSFGGAYAVAAVGRPLIPHYNMQPRPPSLIERHPTPHQLGSAIWEEGSFNDSDQGLLRGPMGCRTGNGDKLSSSQTEPGQATKSAVAQFPSTLQ